MALLRADVRPHGDHARRAQAHHRHDHVVVAGEHAEVVADQPRDLRRVADVAARLLDARDVRMLRQARAARRGDRAAGAARHVVQDDRRIDGIGHRREVAVHALVVRLVVVRGDQQQAVRAHIMIAAALFQLRLRAVGARAADDRDFSVHRLDHAAGDVVVLLVAHGARLAGRAQHDNAVRALLQVPPCQRPERIEIDAAVRVERRHQRHIAS